MEKAKAPKSAAVKNHHIQLRGAPPSPLTVRSFPRPFWCRRPCPPSSCPNREQRRVFSRTALLSLSHAAMALGLGGTCPSPTRFRSRQHQLSTNVGTAKRVCFHSDARPGGSTNIDLSNRASQLISCSLLRWAMRSPARICMPPGCLPEVAASPPRGGRSAARPHNNRVCRHIHPPLPCGSQTTPRQCTRLCPRRSALAQASSAGWAHGCACLCVGCVAAPSEMAALPPSCHRSSPDAAVACASDVVTALARYAVFPRALRFPRRESHRC